MVVGLLVPIVLPNDLHRQMLATMRAAMVAELRDLARQEDWGMALAFFKWTYALMSPFADLLADRVNKRHLIPMSLGAWLAVTWWTGNVTSFEERLLARAVMAAGEAFYMPTALALIAERSGSHTDGGWL
jgi:MFS family permease